MLSKLTPAVNLIFIQTIFIVFYLFLAENSSFAETGFYPDLKLNLNGRTYPIGPQFVGALGLGYPLWGDTQTWKYGYVRGGLSLATSAVVNRVGVEFQVFPISIAGVTFGYDSGIRNFVPKWLDCNIFECTGRVDRKYVRFSLVGAYSGFSMLLTGRYEEIRGFNSAKPLFDEVTLLFGRQSGEHIFTFNPVVLYKVADHTSVGFASLYNHALDSGTHSHLYGPEPQWNYLLGLGLNSSSLVHSAICGFFLLQYNIKPSLGVVDLALRNSMRSSTQDASGSLNQ